MEATTQWIADAKAALAAYSKDQLVILCRAAGWTGDDARTSKATLADWLAQHNGATGSAAQAEQSQQSDAQTTNDARVITARFPGKCAHCSGAIQRGEQIAYSKTEHKAWHRACYAGQSVNQTVDTIATDVEQTTAQRATDATTARPTGNASAVAESIAAALASLQTGVDENVVRALIKAELKDAAEQIRREVKEDVRTLVVKRSDGSAGVNVGLAHKTFPRLVTMASTGCNVFMAGPAGSGKTTAGEQLAKALSEILGTTIPFYFNGAIDTEYKLMGFVDAQGRIVSTAFREAYTNGGVYLFDEVDASLAAALLAFNAALSNGHCDFPGADGPVKRHPHFFCIAAGNTWGYGATVEYVGRNVLDRAFMDRFVKLEWAYDEALERKLANNDEWTSYIQGLRVRAKAKGLKVVISPRASINGAKLLAAGLSREEAADATVFFGLSVEQRANLSA